MARKRVFTCLEDGCEDLTVVDRPFCETHTRLRQRPGGPDNFPREAPSLDCARDPLQRQDIEPLTIEESIAIRASDRARADQRRREP